MRKSDYMSRLNTVYDSNVNTGSFDVSLCGIILQSKVFPWSYIIVRKVGKLRQAADLSVWTSY